MVVFRLIVVEIVGVFVLKLSGVVWKLVLWKLVWCIILLLNC